MRLPIIRHLTEFAEQHDADYLEESIAVLEALADAPSVKDEELDTIGELLSNLYGALEVNRMIDSGTEKKEAIRTFMDRVLGSIDR